ncbi:hypothetical protein [Bradyrhizobium sp. CCBAU 53415]|uniref:hypothetical protein n=1 Tax=Bradyrhizobium sp. CCBAU 53415 TaxID=1325119 RepID=UPI0023059601|nr:hypothetical protein [Bradyrhizobium sp. CCBAU 53415]
MTSTLRSVTEGLVERVARWLGVDRDGRELHNLDETEIAAIARDLRMPVSQLKKLAAHGRGAKKLTQLLQQLGLDEAAIAEACPDVLRDMSGICALCVAKTRCSHDLARRSADLNYARYCPSGPTIGAMQKAKKADEIALHRGPLCC